MSTRKRREYLQYLDASKSAAETAIDAYNRCWHPYRNQTTLLLMANAWELLGKAVLLHKKQSIKKGGKEESISAEQAVYRVQQLKILEQAQAETIQQVVSLRHAACHGVLPEVPAEVMQHLLFYAAKFFRQVIGGQFPAHLKGMSDNYLSLSFSELLTYADKVQRSISKVRRSPDEKRLIWMLERGVCFDGTAYISQAQFDATCKKHKKLLPALGVGRFLKSVDMVRLVPVEAPKNFTADITLRKNNKASSSLPVVVRRTDPNVEYPYLTKELGEDLGEGLNWVSKAIAKLGLKGNDRYHLQIRSSTNSTVHRYSEATLEALRAKLAEKPDYDPWHD